MHLPQSREGREENLKTRIIFLLFLTKSSIQLPLTSFASFAPWRFKLFKNSRFKLLNRFYRQAAKYAKRTLKPESIFFVFNKKLKSLVFDFLSVLCALPRGTYFW